MIIGNCNAKSFDLQIQNLSSKGDKIKRVLIVGLIIFGVLGSSFCAQAQANKTDALHWWANLTSAAFEGADANGKPEKQAVLMVAGVGDAARTQWVVRDGMSDSNQKNDGSTRLLAFQVAQNQRLIEQNAKKK